MRRASAVLLAALALALAAGAPAAVAGNPVGIAESFPTNCDVDDVAAAPGGGAWFACTEYFVVPHLVVHSRAKSGRISAAGKVTEFPMPTPLESAPGDAPGVVAADGSYWFPVEESFEAQTELTKKPVAPSLARVTPSGQTKLFPITQGFVAELVASPNGYLWFVTSEGFENDHPVLWQISPAGVIAKTAVPLADKRLPGLVVGTDGNLWFADAAGFDASLFRLTPTGELSQPTDQSPGFAARRPTPPEGVIVVGTALGADGNLWYSVQYGDKPAIGRVTPTGETTEFRECLAYGQPYFGPELLALGAEGNLWFTSLAERSLPNIVDPASIGLVTPTGAITQIYAGVTVEPKAIAAGPEGGAWFAGGLEQIQRIKPPQGVVNTVHIGKLNAVRRNGSALLTVKVPSGGRLRAKPTAIVVGSHPKKAKRTRVHAPTTTAKATACGSPQIRVKLAGEALERLRSKGKVQVSVAVTFIPAGGHSYTEEKTLRFQLPRR